MRDVRGLPAILFFGSLILATAVFGGDGPKRKRRPEYSIAELTSRVANVQWPGGAGPVARMTILPSSDCSDETDNAVGFVEFEPGLLGIYVARQNPEADMSVVLRRADLGVLRECAERARTLNSR